MLVDTVLVVLLQDSGSGYCGCSSTQPSCCHQQCARMYLVPCLPCRFQASESSIRCQEPMCFVPRLWCTWPPHDVFDCVVAEQ